MIVCVRPGCGAESPDDARFCVACGYALRQACPYLDCGSEVAVKAPKPLTACPTCKKFLLFCANCARLHRLDETVCRTRRCAAQNFAPREIFFPCQGEAGATGEGAAQSPVAWKAGVARSSGARSFDDQSLGARGWSGAAFRFGKLVLCGQSGATCWPMSPRRQKLDAVSGDFSLRLERAPLQGALWPDADTLRLAFGFGFLLGHNSVQRFSLFSPSLAAQQLEMSGWSQPVQEDDWFSPFPAAPTALDWNANDAPPALDLETISWRFQTCTRTRWLALGQTPAREWVAVSSGALDVEFQAQWEEVPAFQGEVLGLWADDDDVLLATSWQLWRRQSAGWERLALPFDWPEMRGVLLAKSEAFVWGEDGADLWAARLGWKGEPGAGAHLKRFPVRAATAGLSCLPPQPVLLGHTLCFAAQTRESVPRFVLVAWNGDSPLEARPPLLLGQGARPVWWLGATQEGASWVVLALDDGRDVEFQALPVLPFWGSGWTITKKRPRRNTNFTPFCATLAQGRFALAWQEDSGPAQVEVFDLSEAAP